MPVNIHGKDYKTVAERVNEFRGNDVDDVYSIVTELVHNEGDIVIVKASVCSGDGNSTVIATGYAEEVRGSTNINKTSALENCETSAVGRALANFGLAGTEFASADEVANAIGQQKELEVIERYKAHGKAIQDNLESILYIKQAMAEDNLESAVEAFSELSEVDKTALYIAPTKGGVWTVAEYKTFKSNEWSAARKSYFGDK